MPRGVRKVHARLPYFSVVPLAVATGAFNTVSSPTIAHKRLSCRETMSRNPVDLSALSLAETHSRLSVRDRNRRSDAEATTTERCSGVGDVSCDAKLTVRLGASSSARCGPECWADAQDGRKARTNSDNRFMDS